MQRVRPDNIFFKEQQSQTRKRARIAPNDRTGCVVCFALTTTNLIGKQRHFYFFLNPKWGLAMTVQLIKNDAQRTVIVSEAKQSVAPSQSLEKEHLSETNGCHPTKQPPSREDP